MNISVIGASAGVGFETVKRALQRNHKVTALSRSDIQLPSDPNWTFIKGDATNKVDLKNAIQNADAVMITLGSGTSKKSVSLYSDVAKVLLELHQVYKFQIPFIILTGFGAGQSRNYVSGIFAFALNTLLKSDYADKTLMEDMITQSTLKWIIVRPGSLRNRALTENYQVETKLYKKILFCNINRADVADYMVKQAENPTELGMYLTFVKKIKSQP